MRIPLGSAKGSILEATLTASPYRSPCLCSTSPTWTPTLTETLRSLGRLSLRLESMAWIRIAHLTASSPLGNSTRNMSPTVFHLSPVVAGEEWSQKLPVFFQEIERERLVLSGQGGIAHNVRTRRRSEEHTSELQSQSNLVCRLLLEKKKTTLFDLPSPADI